MLPIEDLFVVRVTEKKQATIIGVTVVEKLIH
jgi:hypothetical protein